MKSKDNNDLQKNFDREFAFNAAMREAEEYQNPFCSVMWVNNGKVVHEIVLCNN